MILKILKIKSIKTQLIVCLVCFSLFLASREGNFLLLRTLFISAISSMLIEAIILYLKTKVFQVTESAVITGLIIGFVFSGSKTWWELILASVIAIFSKHLIRFQGRHIFNPAAFGIFLSTILLGISLEWKGTYLWYLLVPAGIYFAYKIKKTEVVTGYAVIALLLFGIQAVLQKVPLWNIFGYLSYFYIFVMVIEPKTTPIRATGKYLFGAGIAALIFIFTELGARFDVELFSLLAMNGAVSLLNKISLEKGGRK